MNNQARVKFRNAKSSECRVKKGNVAVVENFNQSIDVVDLVGYG